MMQENTYEEKASGERAFAQHGYFAAQIHLPYDLSQPLIHLKSLASFTADPE